MVGRGPGTNSRSLFSPIRMLRGRALWGVLGGNRRWMIIGGILWGGGKLRRAVGRHAETLTLPRLAPGESVSITAVKPPSRRQRRAAQRGR